MTTAATILILSGIGCLFVGALSGIPMGLIRSTKPEVPKYLTMVHLSGYMQGPLLIVLGLAINKYDTSDWVAVLGALIVSSSAFLLILKI